jgi:hypothetical protein
MVRRSAALHLALGALLLTASLASAQAPSTILYQGRLADAEGASVTGDTDVTFLIYDAPTDGILLWQEDTVVSPNANGLFTVELGEGTPFAPDVFSGEKRWLTMIVVEEGEEMTPRQVITSAPYAMRNGTAPKVAVVPISGRVSPAGAHEIGHINITPPGPGFLHVAIRGSYWLNYDATSTPVTTCFNVALCTTSGTVDEAAECGATLVICYQDADLGSSSNDTHAFVLDRIFPVGGGLETYYLNMSYSLGAHLDLYTHCNAVVWWYPESMDATWAGPGGRSGSDQIPGSNQ